MIYVLTEWDGKGSGEKTLVTKEKSEAMSDRECTLTYKAAVKKYGKNHFRGNDVKCSTIDSYSSEHAMREGDVKTSENWY
jgi:hypothetical protein